MTDRDLSVTLGRASRSRPPSVVISPVPTHQLTAAVLSRVPGWRGLRMVAFMQSWAIAESNIGHAITIEEFGAWWRDGSLRTAYRRLAEFREAFAPLDTPSEAFVWPKGRADRVAARSALKPSARLVALVEQSPG